MIRKLGKRLRAWGLLAWRLMVNLAHRPFKKTGRPLFDANFAHEGLFALTSEQRARYGQFSRCIGCGLCETLCAGLTGVTVRQPWRLPLVESRSLPDLDAARDRANQLLGCEACGACETACPTNVPLRDLAAFITAHADRRPGPAANRTE